MSKRLIGTVAVVAVVSAGLAFGLVFAADDGSENTSRPTLLAEVLAGYDELAPPAAQSAALQDGVVSMGEFNEATAAYAACGETAGFTAEVVDSKGLRPMHVSFEIPADADADPDQVVRDASAVLADCRMQHLDAVQTVWELQKQPPTDAEVESLYDWLDACLAGEVDPGTDLKTSGGGNYPNAPEGRSFDVAPPDRILYLKCAAEAEALTGLDAPPPFVRAEGVPGRP